MSNLIFKGRRVHDYSIIKNILNAIIVRLWYGCGFLNFLNFIEIADSHGSCTRKINNIT